MIIGINKVVCCKDGSHGRANILQKNNHSKVIVIDRGMNLKLERLR